MSDSLLRAALSSQVLPLLDPPLLALLLFLCPTRNPDGPSQDDHAHNAELAELRTAQEAEDRHVRKRQEPCMTASSSDVC